MKIIKTILLIMVLPILFILTIAFGLCKINNGIARSEYR